MENSKRNPNFSPNEESKLRDFISQMKAARKSVQTTVVELESLHSDPEDVQNSIAANESQTADLEMAVLVQV